MKLSLILILIMMSQEAFSGCEDVNTLTSGHGHEPKSLSDLAQDALDRSYQLKIANLDIEDSRDDVMIARSKLFPQINLNTGVSHVSPPSYTETVVDRTQGYARVDVGLLLYDFGRRIKNIEASEENVLLQQAELSKAEQEIMVTAVESYLAVLKERLRADALKEAYQQLSVLYYLFKDLSAAQDVSYELAAVVSKKTEVCVAIREQVEKQKNARNYFIKVYGYGPETFWLVEPQNDSFNLPTEILASEGVDLTSLTEMYLNEALRYHPDFIALAHQVVIADNKLDIAYTRGASVQLNGGYGYYNQSVGDDPTTPLRDGWSVSINVNVPIGTGGRIRAETRKAARQVERLNLMQEDLIMSDFLPSISNLLAALSTSLGNIKEREVLVESTLKQIISASEGFLVYDFNGQLSPVEDPSFSFLKENNEVDRAELENFLDVITNYMSARLELHDQDFAFKLGAFNLYERRGKILREIYSQ